MDQKTAADTSKLFDNLLSDRRISLIFLNLMNMN